MFLKSGALKKHCLISFCVHIILSSASLCEHTFSSLNHGWNSGCFEPIDVVFGEVDDYSVKSLKQEANEVILGFLAKHFSKRRIHRLRVSHTTPISTHSPLLHNISVHHSTIPVFYQSTVKRSPTRHWHRKNSCSELSLHISIFISSKQKHHTSPKLNRLNCNDIDWTNYFYFLRLFSGFMLL